jgi:cytochrome b561
MIHAYVHVSVRLYHDHDDSVYDLLYESCNSGSAWRLLHCYVYMVALFATVTTVCTAAVAQRSSSSVQQLNIHCYCGHTTPLLNSNRAVYAQRQLKEPVAAHYY